MAWLWYPNTQIFDHGFRNPGKGNQQKEAKDDTGCCSKYSGYRFAYVVFAQ